jgi:large subunit ribosomal protein L32e
VELKDKQPEKPDTKIEPSKRETDLKEEYIPKKKPDISDDIKQFLIIRNEKKSRTPQFYREEWFRYKRLGKSWRRPDGISSKMRRNFKYRPSKVRVGFRGPKKVRGLHPSGFEEIMVFTVSDLETIDPKTQAARIGSSVGTRKRMEIEEKATELDVRILNKQR